MSNTTYQYSTNNLLTLLSLEKNIYLWVKFKVVSTFKIIISHNITHFDIQSEVTKNQILTLAVNIKSKVLIVTNYEKSPTYLRGCVLIQNCGMHAQVQEGFMIITPKNICLPHATNLILMYQK